MSNIEKLYKIYNITSVYEMTQQLSFFLSYDHISSSIRILCCPLPLEISSTTTVPTCFPLASLNITALLPVELVNFCLCSGLWLSPLVRPAVIVWPFDPGMFLSRDWIQQSVWSNRDENCWEKNNKYFILYYFYTMKSNVCMYVYSTVNTR